MHFTVVLVPVHSILLTKSESAILVKCWSAVALQQLDYELKRDEAVLEYSKHSVNEASGIPIQLYLEYGEKYQPVFDSSALV
jgi:hypothetical protein